MEIMSANTNNAILVTGICKIPILISFNFFTFIYLNLSVLTKSAARFAARWLSSSALSLFERMALKERQAKILTHILSHSFGEANYFRR